MHSWGKQNPPLGAQVNWAHPLSRGLAGGAIINSQSPAPLLQNLPFGAPSNVVANARGAYWDGGLGRHIAIPGSVINTAATSGEISCFAVVYPDGNNNTAAILSGTTNPGSKALIWTLESNYMRFFPDESVAVVASAEFSYSAGSRLGLGVRFSPSVAANFYVNGIDKSSGASSSDSIKTHTDTLIGRSSANDFYGFHFVGDIECVYVWSRLLVPSEMEWLNAEPYAFIQPPQPWRKYFIPGTTSTERRAYLSWAEIESPLAPRRTFVTFGEFEVPLAPRRAQVAFAEIETPLGPRRVQIAWAEVESPLAPRRVEFSWSEMEVPTAPRSAWVSWTEAEVPFAPRGLRLSWAEVQAPVLAAVSTLRTRMLRGIGR